MSAVQQVLLGLGGTAGLNATTLFNTSLYTGDNTNQVITTGLDMSSLGALVVTLGRNSPGSIHVADTVRTGKELFFGDTSNEGTTTIGTFTSTGFTNYEWSAGISALVWSFCQKADFFKIVTWTGNGTTQTIAHGLGTTPGMVIVKSRSVGATHWRVWHRSLTAGDTIIMDTTAAQTATSSVNLFGNNTIAVAPDATNITIGSNADVNTNLATYVAYVFGHNPSGIIQCDTYTGNGSSTGPVITLGWEPQFLLIKRYTVGTGNWGAYDEARDTVDPRSHVMDVNLSSAAEVTSGLNISITSTGFQPLVTSADLNTSGSAYLYMAIKKGT